MPGIGKGEENGSPEPYRDTGWGALQRYRVGSLAEIQAGEIQKRNGEMVPSGRDNFKIECWLGLGVRLQSLPNSVTLGKLLTFRMFSFLIR